MDHFKIQFELTADIFARSKYRQILTTLKNEVLFKCYEATVELEENKSFWNSQFTFTAKKLKACELSAIKTWHNNLCNTQK